jgi:putative PEP-CTERM system TPR-repeat lipoprotein
MRPSLPLSFALRGLSIRASGAAALVVFVAACGGEKPSSLLASAREALARNDAKTAVVHAKNALSATDNGEVRFVLGKALLAAGDTQGALVHLQQARAAKYSAEEIEPEMSRALLARGEYKRLVAELGSVDLPKADAQASLKCDLGEALLALGQKEDAQRAFAAALAKVPGDDRARAGEGRVLALNGDFPGARAVVDQVLAAKPQSPHALSLQADLFAAEGKQAEAIATLQKLVGAVPSNIAVRVNLAQLLIAQGRLDDAQAEVDRLKKDAPKDMRTSHVTGALALRRGDATRARDAAMLVLNGAPDYEPALLLAGAAEFQLGAHATAANHLKKVVAKQPNNFHARNLLSAVYLRQGLPEKAEDVLSQALARTPNDPAVLRAAGEVAVAANKLKDAARYYERAIAVDKDQATARTRLAQIRLAAGETERALADLEIGAASGNQQLQSTLALVSTHLSRGDTAKAEAAVAALTKDLPNHPLPHALRASVALSKKDTKTARVALEKALAAQFDYVPAARVLAELDLADKNVPAAMGRLETILAKSPAHEGAWLALANVQSVAGKPRPEVSATYDRAIKANPASVLIRVAQGRFLTDGREIPAALTAAKAAFAAIPNDARIADLLGLAQMASGDAIGAIETYNTMARLAPDSPVPHLRLAAANYRANRPNAPIESLRKALALQPDLAEAQRGIVTLMLETGKFEEAMKEAKAVQQARGNDATGFAMEGDILEKQKRPAEAARAFGEGLRRQASPELLVKQMDNLNAAGQPAEAKALAARWIKQNPDDPVVRYHAATTAMLKKDYAEAIEHYREIIKRHPNHSESLNNLAWVLGEQKDPGALAMAERAHQSAPGDPSILDTFGWMLAQRGDVKRAVELLTASVEGNPKNVTTRIHLAQALLKSGDKIRARKELEEAAVLAGSSPAKADIDALLKSL